MSGPFPSASSAALKARKLRSGLVSQEEAEKIAKTLNSDSRRSIARHTPRLCPCPSPDSRSEFHIAHPGCGAADPATIVTLRDAASDGDPRRMPTEEQQRKNKDEDGRVDYYVQLRDGHELYKHWLQAVGRLVGYHVCGRSKLLLQP